MKYQKIQNSRRNILRHDETDSRRGGKHPYRDLRYARAHHRQIELNFSHKPPRDASNRSFRLNRGERNPGESSAGVELSGTSSPQPQDNLHGLKSRETSETYCWDSVPCISRRRWLRPSLKLYELLPHGMHVAYACSSRASTDHHHHHHHHHYYRHHYLCLLLAFSRFYPWPRLRLRCIYQ